MHMSLETIQLQNITAFDQLQLEFSRGLNVLIGTNGTGKTHLLKAAYTLCSAGSNLDKQSNVGNNDIENVINSKLIQVFLPLDNKLGNLHRYKSASEAQIKASFIFNKMIACSFNSESNSVNITENVMYENYSWRPVFIPTKEVLSFMKGFTSLYELKEVQFDQTYADICYLLDSLKFRDDKLPEKSKQSMDQIEKICGGRFIFHGGGKVTFNDGKTEYSANAIAEGYRKLGILYRLLENGTINPGLSGPLFWDEPEANMNPALVKLLIQILLELSRKGQQIILATHNYVVLKWIDLLIDEIDQVKFHSLYRDNDSKIILCNSTDQYLAIHPNIIADTFSELYDHEISRSLGGVKI